MVLTVPTNCAVVFSSFSFCILEALVLNLRMCHFSQLDRRLSSQLWRLYLAMCRCCLIQMSFQVVFTTISAYVVSFHLTEQINLVATFYTCTGEVPCSDLATWTGCVVDVYRVLPRVFESYRDIITFTFLSTCNLIITLLFDDIS